jgi:hypothetical protein
MWAPCLVLAHLWSVLFICKALAVLNPVLWRRIKDKALFWRGGAVDGCSSWLTALQQGAGSPLQCDDGCGSRMAGWPAR